MALLNYVQGHSTVVFFGKDVENNVGQEVKKYSLSLIHI